MSRPGSNAGARPPAAPSQRATAARDATRLLAYLRLAVPVGTLFAVVYFASNWITGQRSRLYQLHGQWELAIPFVPAMIYPYASIVLLLLLPGLLLRRAQFPGLARAMVAVIMVAALTFLVLPAQPGFQRPAQVPGYQLLFGALYALDQPYNLVPSLHVACTTLCVAVLLHRPAARVLKLALLLWAGLLSASVVLVHQHHLLDVASGWLLGLAAYRLVYLRTAA